MSDTNRKYQNGKIYQITDNAYTKCYVGSTTQPLSRRMNDHRTRYMRWKNGQKIVVSVFDLFEEFGIENCKIELLEEFPCENKEQLFKKEGAYIKQLECVNKCVAGRTQKEYIQENKGKISENKARYYLENLEKMKEKNNIYREKHREELNEKCRDYHKQNRDLIRIKHQEYRAKHPEVLEKMRRKIECTICGSTVARSDLRKHERTKKCQSKLPEASES